MTADKLEKLNWIPPENKERLRQLMAEWIGPGKGYILLTVPPTPGREGYVYFQLMIDPDLPPQSEVLMSKRQWRRISLEDLADAQEQKRILGLNPLAPGPEAHKRGPETPQDGRSMGGLGITPHQESST